MKKLMLLAFALSLLSLHSAFGQFSSNFQLICSGSTATFTADDPSSITTYSWQFPGGIPATSTNPNPVVTYNAIGSYDVLLSINGNPPVVYSSYINVKSSVTLASEKVDNNWVFGARSSSFDNNLFTFENENLINISQETFAQTVGLGVVSSISNPTGNRLFHIRDNVLINRHNLPMALASSPLVQNPTAYNNVEQNIIVPVPGTCQRLYYVFYHAFQTNNHKLYYCIVDMEGDNGLGEVISSNNIVPIPYDVGFGLTATYDCEKNKVWIATHEIGISRFWTFSLDQTGTLSSPVSSGSSHPSSGSREMKFSPNGDFITAAADPRVLYKFDKNTGQISHFENLEYTGSASYKYTSCEWSQDSKNIYYGTITSTIITQYTVGEYNSSSELKAKTFNTISTFQGPQSAYIRGIKQLELAPDGRIYGSADNNFSSGSQPNPEILVIEDPNNPISSTHNLSTVQLPTNSSWTHWGLNNTFVSKRFLYEKNRASLLDEEYVISECNFPELVIELPEGFHSYSWLDEAGNIVGNNHFFAPTEAGSYSVKYKEFSQSCEVTDEFEVDYGYDPNTFRKSYQNLSDIDPELITHRPNSDGYAILIRYNNGNHFAIQTFDADGHPDWKRVYQDDFGTINRRQMDMVTTNDGYAVLFDHNKFIRFDANGNIIWKNEITLDSTSYPGYANLRLSKLAFSDNHQCLIAGGYVKPTQSYSDRVAAVIKLHIADGSLIDLNTYQTNGTNEGTFITDIKFLNPNSGTFTFCGINGRNVFIANADINGLGIQNSFEEQYSGTANFHAPYPSIYQSLWSPSSGTEGIILCYSTDRFSSGQMFEAIVLSFPEDLQGGPDAHIKLNHHNPTNPGSYFVIHDLVPHYTNPNLNPSIPNDAGYIIQVSYLDGMYGGSTGHIYINADFTVSTQNIYEFGSTTWEHQTLLGEKSYDPDATLYSLTFTGHYVDAFEVTKFRKSDLIACESQNNEFVLEDLDEVSGIENEMNEDQHALVENDFDDPNEYSPNDIREYCCFFTPYNDCESKSVSFDIDFSNCDQLEIINVNISGGTVSEVVWENQVQILSTEEVPDPMTMPTGDHWICVKVLFEDGCIAKACKQYKTPSVESIEIETCNNPYWYSLADLCDQYEYYEIIDHDPSDDQWHNYNYTSPTGCNWITHGLIPGHYTFKLYNSYGCVQHTIELDIIPSAPENYTRNIELCPEECEYFDISDIADFPCQPNNGVFSGVYDDGFNSYPVQNVSGLNLCHYQFAPGSVLNYQFTTDLPNGCPCTVSGTITIKSPEECQVPFNGGGSNGSENGSIGGLGEDNIKVTLYPNPASTRVTINTQGIAIKALSIRNAVGQTVRLAKGLEGNSLDISNYADGVYLIQIELVTGETHTKKLVLQH